MKIKCNKKWMASIVMFGLLITYTSFGHSKTSVVTTVSFTGIVPDIKCDSVKMSLPSFTALDTNNDGRLSKDEFTVIKNHEFSAIDFDENGYISPIELSVYKKRNCLM